VNQKTSGKHLHTLKSQTSALLNLGTRTTKVPCDLFVSKYRHRIFLSVSFLESGFWLYRHSDQKNNPKQLQLLYFGL